MKEARTWQVPTLVMHRRMLALDADLLATSRLLQFISPAIRQDWQDPRVERSHFSQATNEYINEKYKVLSAITAQMQKEGVLLLAGTDTGDPYSFPGEELHRELEALVGAGLTPREALQTATLAPESFLGAKHPTGDLLLLDGNPLEDIRNTRKIFAVILRGQYLSRQRLDAMLK